MIFTRWVAPGVARGLAAGAYTSGAHPQAWIGGHHLSFRYEAVWALLNEPHLFPDAKRPPKVSAVPDSNRPRELLRPFTTTLTIKDIDHLFMAFRCFSDLIGSWVYRGQPFTDKGLSPSIERVTVPPHSDRLSTETYIRTEFKRRAPHYLPHVPDNNDELAWLALMRHHGAPSRLLDWTRSPYVAAFFAVSGATLGKPSEVWAIDQMTLNEEAARITQYDVDRWKTVIREQFRTTLLEPPQGQDFIAPLEPFDAAERMIIQQGLFLASSKITVPFATVLAEMALKADRRLPLLRIQIQSDYRMEMLAELERMNITEATLFPGIDGFARSLRTSAENPDSAISDYQRKLRDHNRPLPPKS